MTSARAGNGRLRILLVAYCFPPMNSIASHRPYGWARTWRDLGHEVHVLTPAKRAYDGPMDLECDLAGMHVHETAGRAGSAGQAAAPAAAGVERWERLKTATRRARFSLAMFGDPRLLAYFALVREGAALLRSRSFDLIVATSPPEVALFAARALSRRSGIPWVADFRDLWFHDTRLQHSRLAAALAGPVNRWLVRNAAALVTVSAGLQKRLSGYLGREVLLSYNGHSEDAPPPPRSQLPADGRIHIVYTGRVYPEKQDPEPLFRALAALRDEPGIPAGRLVVDFYGFENPWLTALAARYRLDGAVRLHGFVPHRASLAAQRAADVLLFLDWTDAAADGVLTGKLFEYFGSGRPLMALGPRRDSEAALLIAETGSGVTLCSEEELAAYLRRLANGVPALAPAAAWERLSRRYQARAILAELQARLPAPAPLAAASE
jgi:glycosyltransferase involved in cell wall biosynthesis